MYVPLSGWALFRHDTLKMHSWVREFEDEWNRMERCTECGAGWSRHFDYGPGGRSESVDNERYGAKREAWKRERDGKGPNPQ